MARVTATEVKEIISTSLSDAIVNTFIGTANLVVTEDIASITDPALSSDRLKQIELYLSAHLVSLRERQLRGERMGDAEDMFLGMAGKGLDFTQYGQIAKSLDTTGVLAGADTLRTPTVDFF